MNEWGVEVWGRPRTQKAQGKLELQIRIDWAQHVCPSIMSTCRPPADSVRPTDIYITKSSIWPAHANVIMTTRRAPPMNIRALPLFACFLSLPLSRNPMHFFTPAPAVVTAKLIKWALLHCGSLWLINRGIKKGTAGVMLCLRFTFVSVEAQSANRIVTVIINILRGKFLIIRLHF
jgi:hypothetical protein